MEALFKFLGSDGGLIGMFLLASLTVNGLLFKMLMDEKDKRLKDAQTILSGIATSLTFIKDSLELINEKVKSSSTRDGRDEH